MKRRHAFYFLLVFSLPLYGSDLLRLPDIRSLSLGNNGVTQTSLFNPSLVALTEERSFAVNCFNRYGLKELGSLNGTLCYPNRVLPTTLHIYTFGYDAYRETMFRVAVAKRLNGQWAVGVAFHYSMLETELYEDRRGRVSADIGAAFTPFENLLIAMLIMNFPSVHTGDQSSKDKDFKGYVVQVGLEWEIINNLLITGYAGTDKEEVLTGSVGLEYQAFRSFYLRSGLEMKPLLPCFGAGVDFAMFTLDAGAVYHAVLGFSMGVGLSFSF